jgi:hypothetical protein
LILGLIGGQRKQEGETWWQYSFRSPLALASSSFFRGYVVWFAWKTGGWVPIGYVIATFPFLEHDIKARRSLKENLTRRPLVGSLTVMLIAGVWMSSHLSFGNVAPFVLIICIIVSDIYLHTSSDQESLALSHPQS